MSKKNLRKTAAIGLAFIGLAGVGVASAATLDLTGGNQDLVQANTVDFSGDGCQVAPIVATFTLATGVTPGSLGTGGSFGYPTAPDAVRLTGINAAAQPVGCAGKVLKVALGDDEGNPLGEYTGSVSAGTVTLSLAAAGNFGSSAVVVDDIDQISVTIYDA